MVPSGRGRAFSLLHPNSHNASAASGTSVARPFQYPEQLKGRHAERKGVNVIQIRVSSTSLQRFRLRAHRALAAFALMPAIVMLPQSSVAAQDNKPPFTPGAARLFLRSTSDALIEKQREKNKTF